jgi:hypothetical protein
MGGNVGREVAFVGAFFGPGGTRDNCLVSGGEDNRTSRSCDGIEKNP